MMQPLTNGEQLVASIILSIGSFLFLILLWMTYFSRKKENNIRTKLYGYIILSTIFFSIMEFLEVIVMIYSDSFFFLWLTYKLHFGGAFLMFIGTYYYSIVFLDGIETNSIWDVIEYNIHTKIMTIFSILLATLFILLPFDFSKISESSMYFFPGIAGYICYMYCALVEVVVFIHLLRKNNVVSKRKKIGLWSSMGVLIICFIVQILAPTIGIVVIGSIFIPYCLYFTVENPDLIIAEELEEVKTKIDKSNRAKTDFLSNMSYEIKKPMREIVQYSNSIVNEKYNEEEIKNNLKNIITSGNNLLYTVNNILDISRIESGDEVLEFKNYSLKSILMEIINNIDQKISNKSVKFSVDIDEKLPDKLYGDGVKLLQIMMNIIINSIEHTEVGMIKLQINGSIIDNNVQLHIRISDTGEGMKKEEYSQLMNMLSKLDEEFYSDIGNTGLGLAVCKKYLDLMEGKLEIETEYKAGTITKIELKQKIVKNEPIGSIYYSRDINKKHIFRDCSGYKVLIVDDNKDNLIANSLILSKYNFTIETLDNAKDCIYKIKGEEKYDLIFIDHMMPEMDGIETIHILRKLEGYELPPIIILTANVITGMKELYIKEGYDDYLEKPINITELEKIIDKYIK